MSKQSPLIQYTKKGPPYVKTGGNHDELSDPTTSDAFSGASERCSVKGCTNTFATQPPKIFVPFPTQPSKRTRWLKVIGIDPEHPPSHKLFCCEDHFDLKRDVMHLSTLRSANSGIVPNLLKDTVVPHIHTNRNVAVESQVNSSAGYRTPLDEQMQVFLTQKTSDTDPLSSSSAECVVKDEPDPDPISAPLPRIRVKSSHELMISSTSSFSEPPKSQTRPPESRKMQRTSVIHKPLTSLTPISVIRSNPQTPNTSATPGTVDKYRECAVQGCPYNLRTFPNISLVYVPIHESFRKAWYKAIGRAYTRRSSQENIYVCSSHFNEDQLEVVMPPGTPGARRSNHTFKRAKPGVLPSINLDLSSKAGEVQATPPLHSMMDQLPRVPDLTPHSPSALMSGSVNLQVPPAAKSHAQSLSAPQHVVSPRVDKDSSLPASSKPVTPVQPRCQKYVAKSMPQYPDCKHKPEEEYQCKDLSVVDCSTFYSQFHSLETRDEQNGFIFAHTEMIASSSQEPEQPVFKFFMEQKKSHGVTRRIQVCAHAFSTCLSFEITALISLVTRHFDTIQPRSDSKPSLVLKSVKMEEASDEDDVMMYESAPAIVEIEDSPDEEKVDIKIEIFEAMPGPSKETEVESDVNRPLTVEEELRQTVRDVFEGFRTSGLPDEPENMECDSEHVPKIEPNAFESVHICKRCLAQFITKAAFEEHVNEVGSCNQFMGEFFKCSTCGRTLTSFEDLKVHTNVYHTNPEGELESGCVPAKTNPKEEVVASPEGCVSSTDDLVSSSSWCMVNNPILMDPRAKRSPPHLPTRVTHLRLPKFVYKERKLKKRIKNGLTMELGEITRLKQRRRRRRRSGSRIPPVVRGYPNISTPAIRSDPRCSGVPTVLGDPRISSTSGGRGGRLCDFGVNGFSGTSDDINSVTHRPSSLGTISGLGISGTRGELGISGIRGGPTTFGNHGISVERGGPGRCGIRDGPGISGRRGGHDISGTQRGNVVSGTRGGPANSGGRRAHGNLGTSGIPSRFPPHQSGQNRSRARFMLDSRGTHFRRDTRGRGNHMGGMHLA
uniref:Collagen alpha-4(VI) chain n=1 Tax=Lygus hesperus TaxID=30085 RepID=A0A0A9W0A2_LYGHE